MGIENPFPSSLPSECKKCANILKSFVNPDNKRDKRDLATVIPASVLSNAKGLAILTVLNGGFIGSARGGSGLVVARLPDGSWSAPSAIGLVGAGFGGLIGAQLVNFVFVLNNTSAVKTFAQAGSLTLGGNVSLAAGPVGRTAEAAGAASLKSVAGIFSYSRSIGLFAGVSLEGSAIIERRDTNETMYGTRYTAAQILTGSVSPPPGAQHLMTVLNERIFSGMRAGSVSDDSMYNDTPVYASEHDDVVWAGRRGSAMGEGVQRDRTGGTGSDEFGRPQRSNTWQDDVYDRPNRGAPSRSSTFNSRGGDNSYVYKDNPGTEKKVGPGRPAAPKPNFGAKKALLNKNEAVALYNFDADQAGDLGFKKGDVITVLKKTDSDNDWWTGMIGSRHGIFPSNYVKMKE